MAVPKPEEDDCERPACRTMYDMLAKSGINLSGKKQAQQQSEDIEVPCPLGREELGRATWSLLHTAAAWFPESPNKNERQSARQFVHSLAQLYPCTHCADDFREAVAKAPPAVDSRADLVLWACMQHNIVNEKLGKQQFECSLTKLDERWRNGHPKCRGGGGSSGGIAGGEEDIPSARESLGQ